MLIHLWIPCDVIAVCLLTILRKRRQWFGTFGVDVLSFWGAVLGTAEGSD